MKFIFLDDVASTNDAAVSIIKEGECLPFWVTAKSQSSGRGRRGRAWTSTPGNLYCTGVYPTLITPQKTGYLSFVAALAVAAMLEDYVDPSSISIKWPNDVLVAGAKVSGILLEAQQNHILIGIGVNLIHHPEDTPYPATHVLAHVSEAELAQPEPTIPTTQAALASLAAHFDRLYKQLTQFGFAPIREQWLVRASGVPGPVTVNLPHEHFSGNAIGLGGNGELQVRLASGTMRDIHAGDVFFGLGDGHVISD